MKVVTDDFYATVKWQFSDNHQMNFLMNVFAYLGIIKNGLSLINVLVGEK